MFKFKILPSVLLSTTLLFSVLISLLIKQETAKAGGCHWADITCNPHLKPITKPLSENAWGEAGGSAYPAAANIMIARHNNSTVRKMDRFQTGNLRPHFGNLVDQVRVIYQARMMDQWGSGQYSIDAGTAGQTYCDRIYIRDSYKPNDFQQLELLAHELVHARQCQQLGGMGKFGFHYFREFKRAGLNYRNNKLEREAYDFAGRIAGSFSPVCRFGGVVGGVTNCQLTALPAIVQGVRYWLDTDPRWPGVYYWTDNKGVCSHGGSEAGGGGNHCIIVNYQGKLQASVKYWLDTDPRWPGVYYEDFR
jgi:hypothetical protein